MPQRPSARAPLESNAQRRADIRRRGSTSLAVVALPLAIVFGVVLASSPLTTAVALTTLVVLVGCRRGN